MNKHQGRGRILATAEALESIPVRVGRWLLILGAIIVLRHFLEQLSGQKKTLYFLSYFIHYPLAYIAPLLALAVILAAFSREKIERVTRLMLFAWTLTLLPPLLDLAFHKSTEAPQLIGYLIPRSSSLGSAFLNLLNPRYDRFQGTTAGIRIEAAVGCTLAAYYVFLKTRNALRSVATFFAVYATMFFFFALPPIAVAVARLLGSDVENVYQLFFAKASVHRAFVNATPFGVSDLSNSLVDLLIVTPLLAIWYRMYDRTRFRALASTLAPAQIGSHVLATLAGMVLGARLLLGSEGVLAVSHPFDVVSIAGVLAASLLAAAAASVLREVERRRDTSPLEHRELLEIGVILFALSSLFALSVSYVALTYVLAMLAVYYLYYAPPLALSRFSGVSGLAVGAALLFSLTLGYSAYAGAAASLWMPKSAVALVLLVSMLALTARELWEPASGEPSARWRLSSAMNERGIRRLAAGAVAAAALLPGVALHTWTLVLLGTAVGATGGVIVWHRSGPEIPRWLGALATVFAVGAFFLGAADAPRLALELENTGFAQATRKAGVFEALDAGSASPEQQFLNEGLKLFERGDYEGAVRAFKRVLETDPDNATAHVSIGSALLRLDRIPEAARAFRKAIAIDPMNAYAHVGLGQSYELANDFENAVTELERALEIDPENVDAVYTLARIHRARGELQKELDALHETVRLDPKHSLAYSRLGEIYMNAGEYREAVAALRAALSGRTPIEHIHTRLAHAYYSLGNLDAAETELRKKIALSPRAASPHAVLARILAEQGRTEEARNEFEAAIRLASDPALRRAFEKDLRSLQGK